MRTSESYRAKSPWRVNLRARRPPPVALFVGATARAQLVNGSDAAREGLSPSRTSGKVVVFCSALHDHAHRKSRNDSFSLVG